MKKLVFMFVAMAVVSFAACGGSNATAEAPAEEVVEAVEAADDEAPVEEVEAPSDSTLVAESDAIAD